MSTLEAENAELRRMLSEKDQMLDQSTGYKLMSSKINDQKKVTREALEYIAEVKRDRSIFTTTHKASGSTDQLDTVSVDNMQNELDKSEGRDEKLMELFRKCEIPK